MLLKPRGGETRPTTKGDGMKVNLNIKGGEVVLSGEESAVSKLIAGTKGKITLNTPFGKRELKMVKELTKDKPAKKKASKKSK